MSYLNDYDDKGQEPKKQFISVILIPGMKLAGYCLRNSPAEAVRVIRTDILSQLDEKDVEALQDVVKQLENYENRGPADRLELERLYRKVSAYLHVRYLREFLWAKPRNPVRGKLGVKQNEPDNGHK